MVFSKNCPKKNPEISLVSFSQIVSTCALKGKFVQADVLIFFISNVMFKSYSSLQFHPSWGLW